MRWGRGQSAPSAFPPYQHGLCTWGALWVAAQIERARHIRLPGKLGLDAVTQHPS